MYALGKPSDYVTAFFQQRHPSSSTPALKFPKWINRPNKNLLEGRTPPVRVTTTTSTTPTPTPGSGDESVDVGGNGGGGDDDDNDDADADGSLSDLNEDTGFMREFNGIVGTYFASRSMITKEDIKNGFQSLKPTLEYVNIKYIEDNIKTMGLSKRFPDNNLSEATAEIQALKNWCTNKKCSISKKEYIRNLCIPLFCHLYINIYTQNKHEDMILFLEKFMHLFSGSVGSKLVEELGTVTDVTNLPPSLHVLRKNRIVYSCSPQFLTSFCKLLCRNHMLKSLFQEWFEIQFDCCENLFEVVDNYCLKHLKIIKNKLNVNDKEYTAKKSNIPDASSNNISAKESNLSQNNDHIVNDSTSDKNKNNDDQCPSTSRDNQKCNNQEPQPSKNQQKNNYRIIISDGENEKHQRKHLLIEKPKIFDDQRPSTSKESQNCHHLESQSELQLSKELSKDNDVIELSSDSESEMPQKNSQSINNKKVNQSLDEQCLSISGKIKNSRHQEPPQSIKSLPNVMDVNIILSSDDESEVSQKYHQQVKEPEVDKGLDDQIPSTSREFQNCHQEPQLNKNQSRGEVITVDLSSSDSESEMSQKKCGPDENSKVNKSLDNQEPQSRKDKPEVINIISSSSDNENETLTPIKHRRMKKLKFDKKHVKRKYSSNDGYRSSSCELESKNKKVYKGKNKKDNKRHQSEHVSLKSQSEKKDLNCEKEPQTQQTEDNLKDKKKFPIKSSFEDSSEDSSGDSSSSQYSFYDEEAIMNSYFRDQNKSPEHLLNKTRLLMKHINVTKIDIKNIDDDLCSTRQITLTNCNKLTCTLLSSDHKYVAAGSMDSIIYVWERSNLSYVVDIQKNIENKTHIMSQNKNLIEFLDKSEAKLLRGHGGSIFDLAEIAYTKMLVSASHDKTFRVWDLETKTCLEVFNDHEHRTWCIAACPFTYQVVTGSCEGASCLWFLKYKSPLRYFVGHIDDVLVIKFHPNQVLIATGSSDKTIRIFELTSGCCKRLLLGHTDYVNCLEFHPIHPQFLASASGNGEVILWNIGRSTIVWKLRVDTILISDLAWFTEKIILASLTSGVILKCDTREDYMKSSKSVKGYTTKFDRLMTLRIYDSIVYTIGIPCKTNIQKTSSVKHKAKLINQTENDSQHQEQKSPREISPSSKLFFPQSAFENNSNSIRPLRRSNSAIINHSSADFLKMDLQRPPFHLSSTDISRLNSDPQSNNIRLIHSPSTKSPTSLTFLKNDLLSSHQNDVQLANPNSSQINIQSKNAQSLQPNVHSTSVNVPQQTHVSLQSQITNVQQKLSKNIPTISTNFQHFQLPNNIQITSTNIQQQQQQVSQLQSVIQPRITTQLLQKNSLQPEQQLQLQQSVGSNFQLANTNIIQQQPVFQQLRPNTLLTKVNVQQLKSQQQTNIRLTNMSIPQSFSDNISRTGPQILAIRQQKSKTSQPSLENTEEDARLRQVVMASLLENNPDLFSRGQTVIGEITRSQSTSQSFNTVASNSSESQQNENNK